MVLKIENENIAGYTTKDGSIIRELIHPDHSGNRNQSLAEAIVPVGQETLLHKHNQSEEVYYILEGAGLLTRGKERFEVTAGDTLCMLAGEEHCIKNTGEIPLKILCCCSPPYSHDDTDIILQA